MASNPLRQRLAYTAASIFLGWHTIAILVAAMPKESVLVRSVHSVVEPYLSLFNLDNEWGYFSPNVGKWPQLKYVVKDSTGKEHTFIPVDDVNYFHPLYRRLGYWYGEIMESPDSYADYAGEVFCQKHAALKPVSVTLLEVVEHDYWPEDRLQGKQPRDHDYVTINTLKTIECQS